MALLIKFQQPLQPLFCIYLFQDDVAERPRMASAISSLANYSAALPAGPSDPDAKQPEKANLGTLMGVYLPCIQNIFGVILFIRMTWIVGTAGAIQGFFVVFLACTVVSLQNAFFGLCVTFQIFKFTAKYSVNNFEIPLKSLLKNLY